MVIISEFGLKIKNIEASTLFEYNIGVRDHYEYKDAMFTNSLFHDFLKENGLKILLFLKKSDGEGILVLDPTKKKLNISRNWDAKADWNISWQSLGTIKSKLIDNITSVRKLPICFKKPKTIKIIIKNTARKRLGAFFIMKV